jgi:hypothetical protein
VSGDSARFSRRRDGTHLRPRPDDAQGAALIRRNPEKLVEASADFLRRKGARADSAEIQKELVRSGILEDGPCDRSRITSYLGRAKAMFDNVRGEGYGLREWRTPSG